MYYTSWVNALLLFSFARKRCIQNDFQKILILVPFFATLYWKLLIA